MILLTFKHIIKEIEHCSKVVVWIWSLKVFMLFGKGIINVISLPNQLSHSQQQLDLLKIWVSLAFFMQHLSKLIKKKENIEASG